jgi:hypothetical protein
MMTLLLAKKFDHLVVCFKEMNMRKFMSVFAVASVIFFLSTCYSYAQDLVAGEAYPASIVCTSLEDMQTLVKLMNVKDTERVMMFLYSSKCVDFITKQVPGFPTTITGKVETIGDRTIYSADCPLFEPSSVYVFKYTEPVKGNNI